MTAILDKHQCLMDIALQECGDVTALYDLAVLNDYSLTELVDAGSVLELPVIVDQEVVQFYRTRTVHPPTLDDETVVPSGIGYMGIGINFKVS